MVSLKKIIIIFLFIMKMHLSEGISYRFVSDVLEFVFGHVVSDAVFLAQIGFQTNFHRQWAVVTQRCR